MDDMLRRLANVEAAVSDIRSDVSGLSATAPHLATKADVKDVETSLIKWIVGTMIGGLALAYTIAKYYH